MFIYSTLRESWQTLINETQNVAREHLHTHDAINEQIQRINRFHDRIKNTAKQVSTKQPRFPHSGSVACIFGYISLLFY